MLLFSIPPAVAWTSLELHTSKKVEGALVEHRSFSSESTITSQISSSLQVMVTLADTRAGTGFVGNGSSEKNAWSGAVIAGIPTSSPFTLNPFTPSSNITMKTEPAIIAIFFDSILPTSVLG